MRPSLAVSILAFVLALPLASQANDRSKAEAMVKEGFTFMKAKGKPSFLGEVFRTSGMFHAKPGNPLYLFVYDMNGVVLAHGADAGLIGVNRINVKDPDGKQYAKEFLSVSQKKNGGWVDYKRLNPETKKIEEKTSYVLAGDGLLIGCGIYK